MKTKTLNFHNFNKKIKPVTSNIIIYLLILIFFSGLIFGAHIIKSNENIIAVKIINEVLSFNQAEQSMAFSLIFLKLFTASALILMIIYFTGLCAVGIPFVLITPVLFGFFIGII